MFKGVTNKLPGQDTLLGHPKEGLYNSAEQKNSVDVCMISVCLSVESKL